MKYFLLFSLIGIYHFSPSKILASDFLPIHRYITASHIVFDTAYLTTTYFVPFIKCIFFVYPTSLRGCL